MPTISMFYGILILMFYRDNQRHHLPHIHVRYQGKEAAVSIEDGTVLDGKLPPKQLKLVQAWIEIHKRRIDCRLGTSRQWRSTLQNSSITVRKLCCLI